MMFANVSHEFWTPLNAIMYSNETVSKSIENLKGHVWGKKGQEILSKIKKWE